MDQPAQTRRIPLLALALALACGACDSADEDGARPTPFPEGEILVNHQPLTEAQITALENAYGVRAVPGDYWYDAQSGLFGTMGMPSQGVLHPGHSFAPLPADASGGTSGAFLNGRQLTGAEVSSLAYFTGAILPGRYWMDGAGNVGYEGDPVPALNLYYLMAQQAQAGGRASAGGGDNLWSSMYGAGNYDSDNSSGYVHIPSTTGGSGTFVSY